MNTITINGLTLTQKDPKELKPGFYMDATGNLAIVSKVTPVNTDEGTAYDVDADLYDTGLEDLNDFNRQHMDFWEFLGAL